jgi:FlaA1/EpsC-like NDP-sugar epimerase
LVEENMAEGITNNVFGTYTIAKAAVAASVERFILISTDKAVRPTNVMGASKRLAELVCQALAAQSGTTVFSMVRFGNVLGSSGSVIPRFRAQIAAGGPVTVTHRDINRFFMTITEAAQLVIQAGAMAKGGDVFVLDMGEPVKILDLAISMVRLSGHVPYVIDSDKDIDPARGDMPIQITGLRKGEKLYEELLIGNNSAGTDHPRIMTASEISLDMAGVTAILEKLQAACAVHDGTALRLILQAAPLDYQPSDAGASDLLIAPPAQGTVIGTYSATELRPELRLVSNSGVKPAG